MDSRIIRAHAAKLVSTARKNMKRKGRQSEVTVTKEDIAARIAKGYCEVTGVAFVLDNPYPREGRPLEASYKMWPEIFDQR